MSDSARYALHRPELLASLERGEKRIAQQMSGSARRYAGNQLLIAANADHPFVYRLRRGWAGRIRRLSDGREQCILIFLPGDLFAVKSMYLERQPDSVRILSPATIEQIHYRELLRTSREDADIANRCMWQVIEEERRLHNSVVGLGQGSAVERVAMLMLDFHGRLALSQTIEADQLTFQMPLTQVQLADHLGITAIHLNRVLKTLRESGTLVIRNGEVCVSDMSRLAHLAGPLLDPYEQRRPEYGGSERNASALAAGRRADRA